MAYKFCSEKSKVEYNSTRKYVETNVYTIDLSV